MPQESWERAPLLILPEKAKASQKVTFEMCSTEKVML